MSTRFFVFVVLTLFCILLIRLVTFIGPKYEKGEVVLETTLLTEPKMKGATQQFWIDGQIFVILPRFPEFHYGETLRISGTLQRRVIENDRTILTIYFPQIEAKKNDGNVLLALARFIRQSIREGIESTLPPTASSLLLGILLGVRESLPPPFVEDLRATGTLHVVAASGMNVTMVGGFFLGALTLFLKRRLALVATIFIIILYIGLASFEPSIVRAGIMGILAFTAQILGRQALSFFFLFIAFFFMLMINPPLLSDVGFQLSFLATLGLIAGKPLLDRIFQTKIPFASGLKESFTTTLAAQIATLPVILSHFGTVAPASLLVNTLVLWTVPPIMVIGLLSSIVGFLFKPLAQLILYMGLPFLLFFEKSVTFFGGHAAAFEIADLPFVTTLGYYVCILSIFIFLWTRKKE